MPICDRFEIAVVPFPFVDAPVVKRRPALALSTAPSMRADGHGVFAMITSARQSTWPSDILLEGWREAGLSGSSILRWKLFTLPEAAVLRRLGALTTRDAAAVVGGLALLLGLTLADTAGP